MLQRQPLQGSLQVIIETTGDLVAQDAKLGALEECDSLQVPDHQDHSYDVVRVEYINLKCVKSLLFAKLESSTNHRWTKIIYKIDSETDSNLIQLNILKHLFQKLQ